MTASQTYIRSADGTHQVHVSYTQAQFRRIWGRLNFGSAHRELVGLRYDGPLLPVVDCPDLDAWLTEQEAEKARQAGPARSPDSPRSRGQSLSRDQRLRTDLHGRRRAFREHRRRIVQRSPASRRTA